MTTELSQIKDRRKALGISRNVLAINAGVSSRLISMVECEGHNSIRLDKLNKILEGLARLERMVQKAGTR